MADAQSAEQMQIEWLKSEMAPHFTQKLLRCTRDILKWIGAHDSDSKHQFPILAGSHLPEVSLCSLTCTCLAKGVYVTANSCFVLSVGLSDYPLPIMHVTMHCPADTTRSP